MKRREFLKRTLGTAVAAVLPGVGLAGVDKYVCDARPRTATTTCTITLTAPGMVKLKRALDQARKSVEHFGFAVPPELWNNDDIEISCLKPTSE